MTKNVLKKFCEYAPWVALYWVALCCLPSDVCHYGVILLSGIRLSEIVVVLIRLSGIV